MYRNLLAIIAIICVIGVMAAAVQVVLNNWRHRHPDTRETVVPVVAEATEVIPQNPVEAEFWRMSMGNSETARLLRAGGRLSTRSGKRVTLHKVGNLTVVVVAASRGAERVQRFVCSRTDGFVSKWEDRRPSDGHISLDQARDVNRHGMKTLPDADIKELMAVLSECYPSP